MFSHRGSSDEMVTLDDECRQVGPGTDVSAVGFVRRIRYVVWRVKQPALDKNAAKRNEPTLPDLVIGGTIFGLVGFFSLGMAVGLEENGFKLLSIVVGCISVLSVALATSGLVGAVKRIIALALEVRRADKKKHVRMQTDNGVFENSSWAIKRTATDGIRAVEGSSETGRGPAVELSLCRVTSIVRKQ